MASGVWRRRQDQLCITGVTSRNRPPWATRRPPSRMGADPTRTQPLASSRLQLPHFLVLGTQKGGTTSLHRLLGQHPQVFLPPGKELHYFTLHDQEPLDWYAGHYKDAKPGEQRGDVTPYYLFHPRAPQRIRTVLPEARLIVLLRDPVERTLSHYYHAKRHGFETLDLVAALASEATRLEGADRRLRERGSRDFSHQKHSYLSRSRYDVQLSRYEQNFPPDQLLVLRSEDLFQNTEALWPRIQSFLHLDIHPLPVPLEQANAGRGEADAVGLAVRESLRQTLQPTNAAVRARYGFGWDW